MLLWSVSARIRAAVGLLVVAVLTAGCWSAPAGGQQPRDGRAGLQLAGTVGSRQLAVSDGAPRLTVGDCDPDVSGDSDVCVIADDIDGQLVVMVIENPDVLQAPATLPVVDPGCRDACDDVTDGVVVDLQIGTGPRLRATGGSMVLETVQRFTHYVGDVRLELESGAVSGEFDVVPRSD
ncbi:hypothetical protein BH23ACT10_BH23ACT10_04770 [soil metagenome]